MRNAAALRWSGRPPAAVLFDLDGTLFDTAMDIGLALNRTLAERGWPPLPETEVRRMVGRGSPILIERAAAAQGRALDRAGQDLMVERFFHHYGKLQEEGEETARPYDGAAASLQELHEAGLRTAIVTNKQSRFIGGMLRQWRLERWIDAVVGGDACARRKPDPEPLLFACASLQVPAPQALMVGDSINDVHAARAAGMPVFCVSYGYNEGEDPRSLPCDVLLDSLAELPALLLPR